MNIYKIENDGFRFQELDLEIGDIEGQFPNQISSLEIYQFSENNISVLQYWPSIQTGFSTIEGAENLIPDITGWIGATLLLSPKAHRLLGELLAPFGEFLPVLIDGQVFNIFNCLTVVPAHSKDEDSFEFDTHLAEKNIAFKAPREFQTAVYCTGRLKDAIEAFGLAGVIFIDLTKSIENL